MMAYQCETTTNAVEYWCEDNDGNYSDGPPDSSHDQRHDSIESHDLVDEDLVVLEGNDAGQSTQSIKSAKRS